MKLNTLSIKYYFLLQLYQNINRVCHRIQTNCLKFYSKSKRVRRCKAVWNIKIDWLKSLIADNNTDESQRWIATCMIHYKITCIKFARQSIGRLNIPVSSPISKMSRAILLDCPNWQAKKPIHLKAATTTVTTFHRTPEEKADPRKRALNDGQTFVNEKPFHFITLVLLPFSFFLFLCIYSLSHSFKSPLPMKPNSIP